MLRRLRSADVDDIDAWWAENYPLLERAVRSGHNAGNTLTARYLVGHAALEGVALQAPELVPFSVERVATSLAFVGPTNLKRTIARTGSVDGARRVMLQAVPRSAHRLALAGARGTVEGHIANASEVLGFRRVTSASPCAFCAMLASRGAVYTSARSAGDGHQYHDDCSCTAEPVYSRNEAPADPRWAGLWREAKTTAPDGVPVATQFRRLVEGRA